MTALMRALSAEALKLKRTLALWLAVLMPMLIITLMFFMGLQRGEIMFAPGEDPWPQLTQNVLGFWGVLILPLFVTLETALAGSLEHTEKSWKHLFALPIPRWAIYSAKLLLNAGLIGLSTAVLIGGTLLAGQLLGLLNPELQFQNYPLPWRALSETALWLFAGAGCLLAIHTWVALRWASFALASTVGIAATLIGFISLGADWVQYYPWTQGVNIISNEPNLSLAVSIGVVGGLVAGLAGCWEMTRRDVL